MTTDDGGPDRADLSDYPIPSPASVPGFCISAKENPIEYLETRIVITPAIPLLDMTPSASHDDRDIHNRIEAIAGVAGWDSFTLLLLLSLWLGQSQQTEGLIGFLDCLADAEAESPEA